MFESDDADEIAAIGLSGGMGRLRVADGRLRVGGVGGCGVRSGANNGGADGRGLGGGGWSGIFVAILVIEEFFVAVREDFFTMERRDERLGALLEDNVAVVNPLDTHADGGGTRGARHAHELAFAVGAAIDDGE
jgi:hypothetical protein